jgi:hypothetical protein
MVDIKDFLLMTSAVVVGVFLASHLFANFPPSASISVSA